MGNIGGKDKSPAGVKETKIISTMAKLQDAYSGKVDEIKTRHSGKVVFAQVILKSDRFALLFNKNCGLIYLGEPNLCALDDVVLVEIKAQDLNSFDVACCQKKPNYVFNPAKMVLFTAARLSSGPGWTSIHPSHHAKESHHFDTESQFEKFIEACEGGYGVSCLEIMAKKLTNVVEMPITDPTYSSLLRTFDASFDYLVWKDAGCAVVVYGSTDGAILVDDKNGLIVCLYKDKSSPSEPPPLAAGVTLYDVEFDFNHFRFVRLSSTGSLASMFEVKSVLIRNYDEDTMTRIECLPVTNSNLTSFLTEMDEACLVSPLAFIDAASKHLVRKDNLYHDGNVPTFRKKFRDILDKMKEHQLQILMDKEKKKVEGVEVKTSVTVEHASVANVEEMEEEIMEETKVIQQIDDVLDQVVQTANEL